MIKVSFVMEHIWNLDYFIQGLTLKQLSTNINNIINNNLKTNFVYSKNGGLLKSSLIKVCYICV